MSWPSFPDAPKTATPAACRSCIAFAVFVPLQGLAEALEYSPPSLKLMFTTLTPSAGLPTIERSVSTQSKPAVASEKSPEPVLLSTLMATISASGATPTPATTPPEVMIPDTPVPRPLSSSALSR